jgi:protein-S-isoprenylcysteine O-methyltransferase Ste14
MILRVALPLYLTYALVALLAHRRRIAKQIGRDPVVIRPLVGRELPHRYLELVLLVGAIAAIVDIGLNAVAMEWVSNRFAIPVLRESAMVRWIGFVVLSVGLVLWSLAIHHMGESWRIGIDTESAAALCTGGLYARVRHPIYSGVLLTTLGLAATTGDMLSVSVAVGCCVALPIQARLEEQFLLSRHGEEFRSYFQRTRRFWPGPLR